MHVYVCAYVSECMPVCAYVRVPVPVPVPVPACVRACVCVRMYLSISVFYLSFSRKIFQRLISV